jgi:hypothetical protein
MAYLHEIYSICVAGGGENPPEANRGHQRLVYCHHRGCQQIQVYILYIHIHFHLQVAFSPGIEYNSVCYFCYIQSTLFTSPGYYAQINLIYEVKSYAP